MQIDEAIKLLEKFMVFADTDLPKGLILPNDWLDNLRQSTSYIKQAIAKLHSIIPEKSYPECRKDCEVYKDWQALEARNAELQSDIDKFREIPKPTGFTEDSRGDGIIVIALTESNFKSLPAGNKYWIVTDSELQDYGKRLLVACDIIEQQAAKIEIKKIKIKQQAECIEQLAEDFQRIEEQLQGEKKDS